MGKALEKNRTAKEVAPAESAARAIQKSGLRNIGPRKRKVHKHEEPALRSTATTVAGDPVFAPLSWAALLRCLPGYPPGRQRHTESQIPEPWPIRTGSACDRAPAIPSC